MVGRNMKTILSVLLLFGVAFGGAVFQNLRVVDSVNNYVHTTKNDGMVAIDVKIRDTVRVRDTVRTYSNIRILDSLTGTYKGLRFNADAPQVCAQDYLQAIGEGDVSGHAPFTKMGFNSDIDDNEEDIWEVGGSYVFPTTKQQMNVISTSAQDSNVSAATGIKQILIAYLDSSYNEKYDTVSMNGRVVQATAATDIWRINYVEAYSTGTGLAAAGTIDVRSTGGTTPIYARISIGYTKSRQAIYTVPTGKSLFIYEIHLSALSTGTNGTRFITRAKYSQLRCASTSFFLPYSEAGVENGSIDLSIHLPTRLPAGTDLKVSGIGTSSSANQNCMVVLRGWLE
jgi:hypothetical protein